MSTQQSIDPVLAANLEELAETATEVGAEGVWILRGAQAAALAFSFWGAAGPAARACWPGSPGAV